MYASQTFPLIQNAFYSRICEMEDFHTVTDWSDWSENDTAILQQVLNESEQQLVADELKRSKREDKELTNAILKSNEIELSIECAKNTHMARLRQLTSDHGMKEMEVPRDGNCFFEATACQIPETTASLIRQKVCEFLRKNKSDPLITGYIEKENFDNELLQLMQEGKWNLNVMDLLPLAIANLFERKVVIFSSDPDVCVQNIAVDENVTQPNKSSPLCYVFYAIPGHEHYNYCVYVQVC